MVAGSFWKTWSLFLFTFVKSFFLNPFRNANIYFPEICLKISRETALRVSLVFPDTTPEFPSEINFLAYFHKGFPKDSQKIVDMTFADTMCQDSHIIYICKNFHKIQCVIFKNPEQGNNIILRKNLLES